jgi:uncharacterized protein with FMN-binding domain
MRRVALTVAATIAGLVLLLGFKSHGANPRGGVSALTVASAPPTAAAPTTPAGTTAAPPPSPSATSSSPAAPVTRTLTGQAIDTRYGPVQVQITVADGRITRVGVTQVPLDTGRDREINDSAVPQLNQEVLTAQSARIDSISGASYTSQGYDQSLQSALDQAQRG